MKRTGFTLIELLVVISIIAILIAILLPALAKARESTQAIACANKIRQVGLGVLMYSQQFDDFLPPDGVYNRNGYSSRSRKTWWPSLVYEYATGKAQPKADSWGENYWPMNGSGFGNNLFCCPSAISTRLSDDHIYIEGEVTYGMNFGSFNAVYYNSDRWFTRTLEVPQPSSTVWMNDSAKTSGTTYSIVSIAWGPGSTFSPSLRHYGGMGTGELATEWVASNSGKTNAWFVDGHVSPIGYDQIKGDQSNLYRGTARMPKR
ncbi:MAG: type II secretion system protein [Phycisphaeraceae bacterium JB051]